MTAKTPEGQVVLPVFGPSLTGDGSPRCTGWTRSDEPCSRKATVQANGRHGALCKQHADLLRRAGCVVTYLAKSINQDAASDGGS